MSTAPPRTVGCTPSFLTCLPLPYYSLLLPCLVAAPLFACYSPPVTLLVLLLASLPCSCRVGWQLSLLPAGPPTRHSLPACRCCPCPSPLATCPGAALLPCATLECSLCDRPPMDHCVTAFWPARLLSWDLSCVVPGTSFLWTLAASWDLLSLDLSCFISGTSLHWTFLLWTLAVSFLGSSVGGPLFGPSLPLSSHRSAVSFLGPCPVWDLHILCWPRLPGLFCFWCCVLPPAFLCSALPFHALEVSVNVVAAATPPHPFLIVD